MRGRGVCFSGEKMRPTKKAKRSYNWDTYELTKAVIGEFSLKSGQMMTLIAQEMMETFVSENYISSTSEELWEYTYVNGTKYYTPDYEDRQNIDDLSKQFKLHLRHVYLHQRDVQHCKFCKYGCWLNLYGREETPAFFEAMAQCLAKSKAKCIFNDIVKTRNGGRTIHTEMIAFSNCYLSFAEVKLYTLHEFEDLDLIAICNQTPYSMPEEYMQGDFKEKLDNEDFFYDEISKAPTFRDMFSAPLSVMKVLLAMIGAGFVKRRKYDVYQMLSFLIGPANRGKTEIQKVIRLLYNKGLCFTPDLQTWGRSFSTGQFVEGIHKMILADELPRTSKRQGMSPTMLCTYADQAEMRYEVKHCATLREKAFALAIFWCANNFFEDWDVTDALLRRIMCIDISFFEFQPMPEPPEMKIKRGEVAHLIVLMTHLYYQMKKVNHINFWAYIFKEAPEICTVHACCLCPDDKVYVYLLRFIHDECVFGEGNNCTREQFNTAASIYIIRRGRSSVLGFNKNQLDAINRKDGICYKNIINVILGIRCQVKIKEDDTFEGVSVPMETNENVGANAPPPGMIA